MSPARSLRSRYVLGLGAMAVLLLCIYVLMQDAIHRQEQYGEVIRTAENQIGLTNRIAFFAEQMTSATSEDEFDVARAQVLTANNKLRADHDALVHGDAANGIPVIRTDRLAMIYHDPSTNLEAIVQRFMAHAGRLAGKPGARLSKTDPSYVHVTTVGPYALENLLSAAADEYEAYGQREIGRLETLQAATVTAALLLLLIEAMFIFLPLERQIRDYVEALKARSDELAKQIRAAEAASRAKSKFLANMSHELRTPLNAIIGFADCIGNGIYGPVGSSKIEDGVFAIHRSGRHLLNLVNDILDISAAESAPLALKESRFPLNESIHDAVIATRPLAEEKGISLTAEDGATRPVMVHADPRRTQQVLLNLISNAIKFTERDGEIRIRQVRLDSGAAGFSVTDNGIGMTPLEILTARERFGQVDERNSDGTGLGIPVAMELMDRHGGTLRIESEKDIGSTFTALFPPERVSEVLR